MANLINLEQLEKTLGIKFQDPKLLHQALIHRSYLNENKAEKTSNERLEFLGDSVLSLFVANFLYHRFPQAPEGRLTSLRSLLVKTKALAALAQKLHLGDFLLMSKGEEWGGGRTNPSLFADTFEAVVGSIFLDQGTTITEHFLSHHLFPLIKNVESNADLLDYKSSLQEIVQNQKHSSPQYEIIEEKGPDHDKTFAIGVFVQGRLLGTGNGKSKQAAEQQAAKLALEKLAKVR